jgi:hypothetical protein
MAAIMHPLCNAKKSIRNCPNSFAKDQANLTIGLPSVTDTLLTSVRKYGLRLSYDQPLGKFDYSFLSSAK